MSYSEEEKKAVEFMKFYKKHCLNKELDNIENFETINDKEFVSKNIETVLNLIETQKAEIDAKEFDIEALKEERENDINKIDKLQVELEKRDREINRLKDELGYTRKVVEGEKRDNAQKKEI